MTGWVIIGIVLLVVPILQQLRINDLKDDLDAEVMIRKSVGRENAVLIRQVRDREADTVKQKVQTERYRKLYNKVRNAQYRSRAK